MSQRKGGHASAPDADDFDDLLETLAELEDEARIDEFLRGLPTPVARRIFDAWRWQAHKGQREPEGDWRVWLLMAGRGFGKTLAGARWVHARARAEPVATRFEAGRAKFAGRFPALEDELAGMSWGGDYSGPTPSPDRADAMVWAMTELMRPPRVEPRIRML